MPLAIYLLKPLLFSETTLHLVWFLADISIACAIYYFVRRYAEENSTVHEADSAGHSNCDPNKLGLVAFAM